MWELTSNKDVGVPMGVPLYRIFCVFHARPIYFYEDWDIFRKHNPCGYGDIAQDISRSMVPLSGRFVTYGWVVGLRGYLHLHFRWLRNISKPQLTIWHQFVGIIYIYILLLDDATKMGVLLGLSQI